MSVDLRFIIRNGEKVLQWRTGKSEIVGNPRHDRDSDKPNTGKYTNRVSWGSWKDVRVEKPVSEFLAQRGVRPPDDSL